MTPHTDIGRPRATQRHGRGSISRGALAWLVACVVLGLGSWYWFAGSRPAAPADGRAGAVAGRPDTLQEPRVEAVVTAAVRRGRLDIELAALGTVTPLNTVVVRSRVDGQLVQIGFVEGQVVKAGDFLAQIDPRPFEVQLALASGQRARNQALLENARADLVRYRTLLEQDSIASQQVDTQASLVRQLEAALQADQGAIESAQLQLAHARIVAPIGGRVGLKLVDTGNIVRASDPGGIVVITQLQPVNVVFSIPEDALARVMKRLRAGERPAVAVFDRSGRERIGSGRLTSADNQIDPATGTIKLKAELPNADGTLVANQFVNVTMVLDTLAQATLVPTAALQRGAAGSFVYVVKDDGTASVVPVTTRAAQGETTVVDGPLQPGMRVVVEGADRLREGTRVELVERAAPASGASGPQPHGNAAGPGAGARPRNGV